MDLPESMREASPYSSCLTEYCRLRRALSRRSVLKRSITEVEIDCGGFKARLQRLFQFLGGLRILILRLRIDGLPEVQHHPGLLRLFRLSCPVPCMIVCSPRRSWASALSSLYSNRTSASV